MTQTRENGRNHRFLSNLSNYANYVKMDFFFKNPALLLFSPYYSALTSCAIYKKSNEPFLRKIVDLTK